MTNFTSGASRLGKMVRAGVALPAYRVICLGNDGKAYLSSFESGNVFGVTTKACAGDNSGVSWVGAGNLAVFTAAGVITKGAKLVVENTGSGLVSAWTVTGEVYEFPSTGDEARTSAMLSQLVKLRNYVGFALEAASSSGDTFLGYFNPKGL
ncbi:MAG: hypothetical protein DRI44_04650 [Chlamydiae bacterium]|nr:MAG: hypothetical protein DRI44_04650 [Chlamydiota bacterium]